MERRLDDDLQVASPESPLVKLVITKDDGIDAPGLQTLAAGLEGLDATVFVVAPASEQSGVGHRLTTRTPIRIEARGENRYAVDGTPADCARVALRHVVPDADYLLSGVNRGANLGSDLYNSGTVAAAREAAFLGCKAAALSQYVAENRSLDWCMTRRFVENLLSFLFTWSLAELDYWNINFPHPEDETAEVETVFCNPDTNPQGFSLARNEDTLVYVGDFFNRPRSPGRDVDVCFGGRVSVSRLSV